MHRTWLPWFLAALPVLLRHHKYVSTYMAILKPGARKYEWTFNKSSSEKTCCVRMKWLPWMLCCQGVQIRPLVIIYSGYFMIITKVDHIFGYFFQK
jgi:hypothetical protein